jgi:hypothetical protein
MKWILASLTAIALGLAGLGVTGCKKSESAQNDAHAHQYTCPIGAFLKQ